MARPKRMGGRVAFYVPPGVLEQVAEIVKLRTERHGGLEAVPADVLREAVVRGLPLVKAAELGGAQAVTADSITPSTQASAPTPKPRKSTARTTRTKTRRG